MTMWITTLTGEAVNLSQTTMLEIADVTDSGKIEIWSVGSRDVLINDFDTREQAEDFIENLVKQLNAPMNFPAQMRTMTQNFLDKITGDKKVAEEEKPEISFEKLNKIKRFLAALKKGAEPENYTFLTKGARALLPSAEECKEIHDFLLDEFSEEFHKFYFKETKTND